jgi:hypothetical protein
MITKPKQKQKQTHKNGCSSFILLYHSYIPINLLSVMNDIITFYEIPIGEFYSLMRRTGAYIAGTAALHGFMAAKNISTILPDWIPDALDLYVAELDISHDQTTIFTTFFAKHGYFIIDTPSNSSQLPLPLPLHSKSHSKSHLHSCAISFIKGYKKINVYIVRSDLSLSPSSSSFPSLLSILGELTYGVAYTHTGAVEEPATAFIATPQITSDILEGKILPIKKKV